MSHYDFRFLIHKSMPQSQIVALTFLWKCFADLLDNPSNFLLRLIFWIQFNFSKAYNYLYTSELARLGNLASSMWESLLGRKLRKSYYINDAIVNYLYVIPVKQYI